MQRPAWRTVVLAALVAFATLAVWCAVCNGPYRLDDFATPLDDPASASLPAWVEHVMQTLRPLTKLTYAVEGSLGIAAAPARRCLSIFIHCIGAAALAMLLARRGVAWSLSTVLALLWALHPVHAESVLSLAGRSAAVGATFVLIALALVATKRAWLAACALGCAVLGREAAAGGSLALAALALSGCPQDKRIQRLAPVALGVSLALVWVALLPRAGVLVQYSFLGRPPLSSVVRQVSAVPVGLSLYFRPWALSCDHGEALPSNPASLLFLLGVTLLAGAAAFAIAMRNRAPMVSAGAALWLGALLPTQSFFPKLDALTERPLGLALAGLILMLTPLAIRLTRASTKMRLSVLLAGCFAVILLGQATLARGKLYASDVALWSDAASKSVENARPHLQLALALDAEGRRAEALAALRRAHDIDPFNSPIQARLRLWEHAHPDEEISP
ncbi:MAG: hypothetical protein ACE14L_08745 [Terriglobales bacterium]